MPTTPKPRSSSGSHNAVRTTPVVPMSERQQISLLMQMTSQDETTANQKGHTIKSRDDTSKKSSNADATQTNMEGLTQSTEVLDVKDITASASMSGANKAHTSPNDNKDEPQVSSTIVSSNEDNGQIKRHFVDVDATGPDGAEEDNAKKKKKQQKDEAAKETPIPKPGQMRGNPRTYLVGTKPPGPASRTGVPPLSKQVSSSQGATSKSGVISSKISVSSVQAGSSKGVSSHSTSLHPTKLANSGNKGNKPLDTRKSPCPSPKPLSIYKDTDGVDGEEIKSQESSGPKVPPLKIVIPGGVGSAGNSVHQQEGESGSGQRSGFKSRSSSSTLPYVIPFNSNSGDAVDLDDGKDDKKHGCDEKAGSSAQRVLRSQRGEKDKDRASPHSSRTMSPSKSPTPQSYEGNEAHSSRDLSEKAHSSNSSVDVHPRKRKIKTSKESHHSQSHHSRETPGESKERESHHQHHSSLNEALNIHMNPFQMFIEIRKQVDRKQKGLFPVQPKPPEGFDEYLMNKCTYVLNHTVKDCPTIEAPTTLPLAMHEHFKLQEKQRTKLRIQHLVEKEKLVLAVEQEILRVHGRAARALANQYGDFQTCPFSACTMLRNCEVYSLQTPEQEEKERNAAQRSRYNGRLFLSWLQDVDDKWDKIKEGMVRRHHTEAESLHGLQRMTWGWKMNEMGLCEFKMSPIIDEAFVPIVHVSDDFDLSPE